MPLSTLPGVPVGRPQKRTYRDRPPLKRRRIFDENHPAPAQPARSSSPSLPDTSSTRTPSPGRDVGVLQERTSTPMPSSPISRPVVRPPPTATRKTKRTTATLGARPNGATGSGSTFIKAPVKTQTALALGQKTVSTCVTCKCTYRPSSPEDVKVHKEVHTAFMKATVVPASIVEKLSDCGFGIKSYSISGAAGERGVEKNQRWILDLVAFVEKEIGAVEGDWVRDGAKVFLALDGNRVKGVLVAERIGERKVYPVLQSTDNTCVVDREKEVAGAVVGVARVWVAKKDRRKGVGKALVEAVRRRFVLGCELGMEEVAFSQPSESGCKLARAVFGKGEGWGVYESV